MKKMIAYCGLDCEKCDAYIATIHDDQNLREKTAKAWSEMKIVETVMGIVTVSIIPVQLLSIIFGWGHLHANVRFTGFCVGIIGDLIFLVSVLCMKDSWRAGIPDSDKTKLVTDGIYRYSRNPAFLGFDLQYIGILLIYFNFLTLIFTVFAVIMLHLQILQEEEYLTSTYGEEYQAYRRQVFRYWGWR